MPSLIDDLNSRYFDGELPQGVLKYFDLESMNSEAREWVGRMFRLMNKAGLGATEFSDSQAWLHHAYWPKMNESNWAAWSSL